MPPKWPHDHEEKHRAAAKLGWRRRKAGGSAKSEAVKGPNKLQQEVERRKREEYERKKSTLEAEVERERAKERSLPRGVAYRNQGFKRAAAEARLETLINDERRRRQGFQPLPRDHFNRNGLDLSHTVAGMGQSGGFYKKGKR